MTLTEVKALLNVTTTTLDTFYETLIPELEQYAIEYTNDDDINATIGYKMFIAKACEWLGKAVGAGVEQEQLGDYSVTYAKGAVERGELPPDVLGWLKQHRRVRWA
jgi:hypothetical protein